MAKKKGTNQPVAGALGSEEAIKKAHLVKIDTLAGELKSAISKSDVNLESVLKETFGVGSVSESKAWVLKSGKEVTLTPVTLSAEQVAVQMLSGVNFQVVAEFFYGGDIDLAATVISNSAAKSILESFSTELERMIPVIKGRINGEQQFEATLLNSYKRGWINYWMIYKCVGLIM